MADISKIRLPGSETTYDIKDAVARDAIAHINSFDYVLSKDAATTPAGVTWDDDGTTITGILTASANTLSKIYLVPSTNGTHDVFDEYITINTGTESVPAYSWEMFGNTDVRLDDLGALAFANTASASYTPAGTIGVGSGTANYTPAGTIGVGDGTANYTPAGTISADTTGTTNYTPEGSVTVTATDTSVYVAGSADGGGSVTDGTAASCTLPTWSASLGEAGTADEETLIFDWSAGSFTANTPTAVTLPTFSSQTVVDSVDSSATFAGTGTELSFAGTGAELTFEGTGTELTFAGTQATVQVSPDPVTP